MLTVRPVFWQYVPAEHGVAALRPVTPQKVPGMHTVAAALPPAQNLPTGHDSQAVVPAKLPAAQLRATHTFCRAKLAAHERQASDERQAVHPVGQPTQTLSPTHVPAAHEPDRQLPVACDITCPVAHWMPMLAVAH